mgnify:CR=1 FL=1
MKSLLSILLFMGSLFLMSGLAHAEEVPLTGFYGGLGTTFAAPTGNNADKWDVENGFGGNLKLGYNINSRFAVELDSLAVAGFKDRYDARTFGLIASINGKGYFMERSTARLFQPYGLVGVGYGHFNTGNGRDDIGNAINNGVVVDGPMLRTGVGVDYIVTSTISVYAEVSYYKGVGDGDLADSPFDLIPVAVGVQVKF